MTFRQNILARSKLDDLIRGAPSGNDPKAVRVIIEYDGGQRATLDAFGECVWENNTPDHRGFDGTDGCNNSCNARKQVKTNVRTAGQKEEL